ncbi:hypothetical protein EDC01DRAFT_626374 [Geopyxis carbonaria]|nr:hypothetical protein EDC01DRAFT_626374 [Geopyxis carbonaria]
MADTEITKVPQQSQVNGEDQKRYLAPPAVTDSIANDYSDRIVPSITDGFKTIQWNDFKKVHQQPCVRDSYLLGMGTGFGIGGLRFVLGGGVPKACNWAVASFVTSSLISYEFFQYRRNKEKEGVRRAMEIIERKRLEKETKLLERKQKALQEAKDKVAREALQQKPWYKIW